MSDHPPLPKGCETPSAGSHSRQVPRSISHSKETVAEAATERVPRVMGCSHGMCQRRGATAGLQPPRRDTLCSVGPASRFPPGAGSAFPGCRTTPRGAVTKRVPFGGRSSRSTPKKTSTNSSCPQGQSPEATGMSHSAAGMPHAQAGRAPSLPTAHPHPQERRGKQGSRAEIRHISTPITPPAWGEPQGARRTFLPLVHVLLGGDTPSMASPAPFPCSGCFCPRRAVLLGLHGHPTLSPGNVPLLR